MTIHVRPVSDGSSRARGSPEHAFGAANHARLRAIKAAYDSHNVFRFNQNIQPA